jgi:hypothetical protein
MQRKPSIGAISEQYSDDSDPPEQCSAKFAEDRKSPANPRVAGLFCFVDVR